MSCSLCIAGPRSEINNERSEQKKERNERTDKWRDRGRFTLDLRKRRTSPPWEIPLTNANEQCCSILFSFPTFFFYTNWN